ncbi:hypothetical protein ABK040_014169 [Willaertia magna]
MPVSTKKNNNNGLLDLTLIKRKNTTDNNATPSKKKELIEKLTKKDNKDIDPENDYIYEDGYVSKKKNTEDYEEDEQQENRISVLRSLDESLTQGKYKGHTVRKEDLFDDENDLQDLQKSEEYLKEIKRIQKELQEEQEDEEPFEDEEEESNRLVIKEIEELAEDTDMSEHLKKAQDLEKQKATSVLNQRLLYGHLLKMRILLQKPLTLCNQLPQTETLFNFIKATEEDNENNSRKELSDIRKDIVDLLGDLLTLQNELFSKGISGVNENNETLDGFVLQESIDSALKEDDDNTNDKLLESIWNVLDKSYHSYDNFKYNAIDKWTSRTKVQNNAISSAKSLKVINASVTEQIQNIMNNEQELDRLIMRTKIKQFDENILGKRKREDEEENEMDEEIFDDRDFYQVLFRDFIADVGGNGTNLAGENISLRRAYTKKKREYVGKTKDRTIKYKVHSQLVNFMAPNVDDEIPESAKTLFENLFGGGTVEYEEEEEEQQEITEIKEEQEENNSDEEEE